MTRIAVFASGTGTNTNKIIEHFKGHPTITVALVVTNKPGAGVLTIAKRAGIPTLILEKEKFFRGNAYSEELIGNKIEFIVLAGFLWKIPSQLIEAYPGKIINIHPALLPRYGGKGMYGHLVHEKVLENKDSVSGISIHYVDELYDHGNIIFQATCPIVENETPESLAQKIQRLEHEHYPVIIEKVIQL